MIVFDLKDVAEHIKDDVAWIEEVAFHAGQTYSIEAKKAAGKLRMFMVENKKYLPILEDYLIQRDDVLNLIHNPEKKCCETLNQTNLLDIITDNEYNGE